MRSFGGVKKKEDYPKNTKRKKSELLLEQKQSNTVTGE
jgi:hypothetical protein